MFKIGDRVYTITNTIYGIITEVGGDGEVRVKWDAGRAWWYDPSILILDIEYRFYREITDL